MRLASGTGSPGWSRTSAAKPAGFAAIRLKPQFFILIWIMGTNSKKLIKNSESFNIFS